MTGERSLFARLRAARRCVRCAEPMLAALLGERGRGARCGLQAAERVERFTRWNGGCSDTVGRVWLRLGFLHITYSLLYFLIEY